MKNKFICLGFLLVFIACSDLEDLNIDIKNPVAVPGETLFTSGQKNLVDQMVSIDVNANIFGFFAQHMTETTYTDEANYDLANRAIPEQHWDNLYRKTLGSFKEATKIIAKDITNTEDQVRAKANKLAIIEVLNVYTYAVLVETFGDIPYSQALDIDNLLPVYDDGLTVYRDLILRLNAALALLDATAGSYSPEADNMYQGDVAHWITFANSLKLRMGIIISDISSESSLAQTTVVSAVTAGVMTSNADNATMEYGVSQPNTNPIYVDLVASGRQDYIAANTLVDVMNALNDPRRQLYFDDNMDDSNTPEVEYIGGIYGVNSIYGSYTHLADVLHQPDFPGTIMSYSQVEFYLAEAAARGYNVGGTVEEHYNAAITASILEWGGTQEMADAYLAQPGVAYSTAPGTWQQKIGTQAWIAYYTMGFEAWTTWRRLDYPILVAPPDARSVIPLRLTYPIVEQTLNGAQYDAASAAIGGDLVSTKLFFDIY